MALPVAGKFAIEGDVNRWGKLRQTLFLGLVCHSTDAGRPATILGLRDRLERLSLLVEEQTSISA